MNVILHILRKEFRQIFRNKAMLPIIFVMPIIQLLILVNAADFELKNINIAFQDSDHSLSSRDLISRFEASPQFNVIGSVQDFDQGMELLDHNKATVLVRIPPSFEEGLLMGRGPTLGIDINGIDGSAAGLSNYYVGQIVQRFNSRVVMQQAGLASEPSPPIQISERYWFNPDSQLQELHAALVCLCCW